MKDELHVVKYSKELHADWDNVINSARNGTFLHLRSYMDYHEDRFEDCSVLILKGDTPIAAFPANRLGESVVSHSGLTFGGLIYCFEQRAPVIRDAFSALIKHYEKEGFIKIYYKAVPHIFHRYPAEDDLYELFIKNARLVRRDLSSIVFVENRPKTSKSRNNGINKAKKHNLKIVDGSFFKQFHSLLIDVLKRHDTVPVHSEEELALLQSRFPDNIRLLGAFNDETLLAASWIFQFGDVLHTQYLACSDEGRKVGALDFLISRIIESSSSQITKISFGISTENNGRKINEGLEFQKEGFGARNIVLDHYELDIAPEETTI